MSSSILFFVLGTTPTFIGCTERTPDQPTHDRSSTPITKSSAIETDSASLAQAIKSLEDLRFYIGGLDSIIVTTDPTTLPELNGILYAFQNSFSTSDSGLTRFKNVSLIRKCHVQRRDGKSGARPSANIVQLSFRNPQQAADWFAVYDQSPAKIAVQAKPKTELWLDGSEVYLIQTYHTPDRDYIELLKNALIGG
jgi:hypothetical protein